MKRIILFSILICLSVISYGQKIEQIKGLRTELNGKLNVTDGVAASTIYYEKDTIDSKLSKKANLYQPALVNPTVTTQAAGDNSTKAASTAFVDNLIKTSGIGRVVLRKTTRVSHTGNTNETTVFTGTIPAGSIGLSGSFHIISTYFATNDGNAKTFKIYFNAVQVGQYAMATNSTNRTYHTIYNRENLAIQVSPPSTVSLGGQFQAGAMVNANSTYTIDTSQDITVTISVTLAVSTDTGAWDSFEVIAYY